MYNFDYVNFNDILYIIYFFQKDCERRFTTSLNYVHQPVLLSSLYTLNKVLINILRLISGKILGTVATNPPYAQFVNKSLAYFLQDLFSLMDRGFVFELVKMYWICVS